MCVSMCILYMDSYVCTYVLTCMNITIAGFGELLPGDDDSSEGAATRNAKAQLDLLAATAASNIARPLSAIPTAEQAKHIDAVMTALRSVQPTALPGSASQARLLGSAAVALDLLPKSTLSSLPLLPAAVVQACWKQLRFEKDAENLRFSQEITAAEEVRVRTMLPENFLHRSSPRYAMSVQTKAFSDVGPHIIICACNL